MDRRIILCVGLLTIIINGIHFNLNSLSPDNSNEPRQGQGSAWYMV